MPTALEITFGGETLVLGSDRTLWWPRQRILFATDLHAGKTEHLRRHGLAIPAGSLEADLARLQAAAKRNDAQRLLFLGDLFHSDINAEWETFAAWSRSRPYSVELVRGNHDRFLSDELLQSGNLQIYTEPFQLAPFTLRHHPSSQLDTNEFILAGHLHPVIWVHGPAQDRLRLTCFWQQAQQLILPAFGSFTGGLVIKPVATDHIYACAPDYQSILKTR